MALFKNNHWIFLILLLCFISCKSTQKPPLPNIEYIYVSPPEQDKKYDSVLYWFPDNYIPKESGLEYEKEFLSDIKKKQTENIMDYSKNRTTFWKFQWQALQEDILKFYNK